VLKAERKELLKMEKFILPFRQVHLDFHTSPDIMGVGDDFDAEEFAVTLKKAHVNSVTLFAKCHHGMLYYDSKQFPERVHPGLTNKNLLDEQIEACHRHGIRTPIYITVQWDYFTAKEHPEWVGVAEDGSASSVDGVGQKPYSAGFYQVLCVNSPYRELLKLQIKEVLEHFSVADGLFFDIVFPADCSCKYCREGMEKQNLHAHIKKDRLAYAREMVDAFKLEISEYIRQFNKDCSIFYNMGHVGTGNRATVEAYSHFELESLPSGGWGYMHFPSTIRYARNLGLDCLGQTGKFHTMWGDFHSFKNQAALEFECFNMLALGAKCLIGDQLEPNGKLSQPVYDLIGAVYGQVEQKEPWCRNAKPFTEIGVFTPEEFLGGGVGNLPPALRGAVRMLSESKYQFDVIDSKSDFSRYRLLVLPDNITVDDALSQKLTSYLSSGGAVIASFESGLNMEKTTYNFYQTGVKLSEEQPRDLSGEMVRGKSYELNDYAEYIIPEGDIGNGLPKTEHVMYIKGMEVEAHGDADVLVSNVRSYFDRTYEHFCSHRQTPSSGEKGSPAIVRCGDTLYFSHPIFTQYDQNAPLWCKKIFVNAVNMLMKEPVLKTNAPSTMLAAVNQQPEEKRFVVHLLHYIPERRCRDIDVIEDIIPLYNVELSVKIPGLVKSVELVPQRCLLNFEIDDGRILFKVPEINGHQMISINLN
jgi:hypothetical protein